MVFIHSSVDEHLGDFHLVTFVNNAAINMGVQISLWDSALNSFGYISRSEIAVSYNNSIFKFLRNCHTVSHFTPPPTGTRVPISSHPCQRLLFSILFCVLFCFSSLANGCEVVSHPLNFKHLEGYALVLRKYLSIADTIICRELWVWPCSMALRHWTSRLGWELGHGGIFGWGIFWPKEPASLLHRFPIGSATLMQFFTFRFEEENKRIWSGRSVHLTILLLFIEKKASWKRTSWLPVKCSHSYSTIPYNNKHCPKTGAK